jgi:hypothetical protein
MKRKCNISTLDHLFNNTSRYEGKHGKTRLALQDLDSALSAGVQKGIPARVQKGTPKKRVFPRVLMFPAPLGGHKRTANP